MLGYYQHPGEAIRVRLGVRVTVALEYICSASKFTEFDTSYPFKLRIITQLEMPLPNSLLRSLLKSWVKCRYSESNHCSIFIQVTHHYLHLSRLGPHTERISFLAAKFSVQSRKMSQLVSNKRGINPCLCRCSCPKAHNRHDVDLRHHSSRLTKECRSYLWDRRRMPDRNCETEKTSGQYWSRGSFRVRSHRSCLGDVLKFYALIQSAAAITFCPAEFVSADLVISLLIHPRDSK